MADSVDESSEEEEELNEVKGAWTIKKVPLPENATREGRETDECAEGG